MPELPEVEVLRRDLEKEVVGKRIKSVEVNLPRIVRRHKEVAEFTGRLVGTKIRRVGRRGKYLLLHLDSNEVLVVHLGMTGRLLLIKGRRPPGTAVHVVIDFTQGGKLRFEDLRTLGEMFVSDADGLDSVAELRHIAIDPIDDAFTWQALSAKMVSKKGKLKPLLMDQTFISGIGNVYSDEILWHAGLRWDRGSDTLASQEVRRLYRAIQEVLQEGMQCRGVSLADQAYVDLYGEPGEFQTRLKVYGRIGLSCRRCRSAITREKVSGRNTYFCPRCQS
ncbi:MAG: bifunctional DNA-formamidopyrimidine glycosylase/DNA-(apurinic or apyrimidinic site) lyase [Actinomycetota bacterium]